MCFFFPVQMANKLELLTEERRYNRHEAGSCPDLQDRLVHKTQLFAMSVQVVTEGHTLRASEMILSHREV